MFRVLGNPLALRIVLAIGRGRKRPMELAKELGSSASGIVNQLRLMKITGVVRFHSTAERRKGRKVTYWLTDPALLDLCRQMEQLMARIGKQS